MRDKNKEGNAKGNGAGALARRSDVPAPVLSHDLELRPRGAEPVSAHRLLAPRLTGWIEDLEEQLRGLKRLSGQAEREGNVVVEAALRAKTADFLTRLVSIAQTAARDIGGPGVIRSQEDLFDWSALPHEVQQKLGEAFDLMEAHRRGERTIPDDDRARPAS